ncbi:MAG: PQQ-binding-like beta-propeller repeat protein [Chromatiales bacterium]|nr:MAG: PQQ-binding-like beta-propeller repeat protein [Chromatiales bacterium]
MLIVVHAFPRMTRSLGGLAIVAAMALSATGCGGDAPAPPEPPAAATARIPSGESAYIEHCAECHNGGVYKAPHKMFLAMMAPDAILASMDGIMASQAAELDDAQKQAVAEYLAGRSLDSVAVTSPPPRCDDADISLEQPPAQLGWGIDENNSRFQSAASGGLTGDAASGLTLKWAFAYPNSIQARSQPTVAGNSVFVGSQDGTVYALDHETGCVRWTYRASAEVRTPIVITDWSADDADARPQAFFGDILARAYALDARTGELLWVTKIDDHPNATITGAPVIADERLIVPVSSLEVSVAADPAYACCTFRGSVVALDTVSGRTLWKSYTIADAPADAGVTSAGTQILAPSGAPVWNSPLVDRKRGRVYAGTGENYSSPAGGTSDAIIAFDLETGGIVWANQATSGDAWNVGCLSDYAPDPANCPEENGPDFDFAAGVMQVSLDDGSDLLIAGQKSGDVMGIDPDSGETRWRTKVGRGGVQGGVHFGMATDGERIYVPINDMAYPEDVTRYQFTTEPRPGLFALDPATGEELWAHPADNVCPEGNSFCDPGISAAITAVPGAVVAGHMDGRVRIYATDDGELLWEFDTLREFDTVSGETAQGGSMSGGGPAVADGMVYINSGYGIYMHMPGNVLLAFGTD